MQFSLGNIERGLESGDSKTANSAAQFMLTRGSGKGEFVVPAPLLESILIGVDLGTKAPKQRPGCRREDSDLPEHCRGSPNSLCHPVLLPHKQPHPGSSATDRTPSKI